MIVVRITVTNDSLHGKHFGRNLWEIRTGAGPRAQESETEPRADPNRKPEPEAGTGSTLEERSTLGDAKFLKDTYRTIYMVVRKVNPE